MESGNRFVFIEDCEPLQFLRPYQIMTVNNFYYTRYLKLGLGISHKCAVSFRCLLDYIFVVDISNRKKTRCGSC